MRLLAASALCAILITGCGALDSLNKGCSGDLDEACQMLFGEEVDLPKEYDDEALESEIERLRSLIATVTAYAETLGENQEALQSDIEDLQADLAEAQLGSHVVGLIDPCGDKPGAWDEVLFQMASGEIVAYFKESGSREYLTVLSDDNYVTTDQQRCSFSIVNGEYVE